MLGAREGRHPGDSREDRRARVLRVRVPEADRAPGGARERRRGGVRRVLADRGGDDSAEHEDARKPRVRAVREAGEGDDALGVLAGDRRVPGLPARGGVVRVAVQGEDWEDAAWNQLIG